MSAPFASRSAFDFPRVMDRYLRTRGGGPRSSRELRDRLSALATAGWTDPTVLQDVEKFMANRAGAKTDARYIANGPFRDRYVRERVAEAFDCSANDHCADVLIYPSVQDAAAPADKGPETAGTHRLAAYSGFPAIAFPIGQVETANGPRPVAIELMGRPGSDETLMALASAWQRQLGAGANAPTPLDPDARDDPFK